jgi:intergrase/recombinase
MVGLPGFEPGSIEPKIPKGGIDWVSFGKWLRNRISFKYAAIICYYAEKYYYVLREPGKASDIGKLPKAKQRNVMAALANLSKYLGVYGYWKRLVVEHGLHWQKTSNLEVFLSIFNTNMDAVQSWFKEAVGKLPRNYAVTLVFAAATGLRPDEACKSVTLLSELAEAGRVGEYLNGQSNMLEHFRYPKLFLRGCKNCYISFVPEELLKLVLDVKPKIKTDALRSAIKKRGMKARIKDLRKLYATTLRENGLSEEVIDLLEGRIPQSIFLRHYYKPDLLRSIRKKVLEAITPIIETELTAKS